MAVVTLARLIVEVGFSGPTTPYLHLDDAARGRLNVARLAPGDIWVDVSTWVVSMTCRTGATRADGPELRYDGGTAAIVLNNNDRRFDPSNATGPYAPGGVTQVEPMRAVRIRAELGGVIWPVWRGFSDDWKVTYTGPYTSTCTLTCKDALQVLAAQDRGEQAPVGAGEDSGARVARILDLAGWPADDRVIATGDSTLQATTLAGDPLSELQLVQDSEMGEFGVDSQGRVVFRNRLALYTDTRSNTSQATFDDSPSTADLPYENVDITTGAQSIRNQITIGRVGGTEQTVEDPASRTAYLTRDYRKTNLLLETDQECVDYGDSLLWRLAQPEQTFTTLTVNMRSDPRLWAAVLGRQLGDRITIVRRPPGGGDPIVRDVYIRGVEHNQQSDLSWKATLVLQSATRGQVFTLDSPTLGRLDQSALTF